MIRFSEPNTKEVEHGVFVDSAFEESVVGDQHYVCVINPERVRGFPVEINLEEGENDAEGLNDDVDENVLDEAEDGSGYVPTTPPKSDQGSDREQPAKRPREVAEEKLAPGPPDPEDPDDPDGEDSDDPNRRNIPEHEGTCFFNMRVGVIGHMTVDVMHVCKHVLGHLLDVVVRKVMVIGELLSS